MYLVQVAQFLAALGIGQQVDDRVQERVLVKQREVVGKQLMWTAKGMNHAANGIVERRVDTSFSGSVYTLCVGGRSLSA